MAAVIGRGTAGRAALSALALGLACAFVVPPCRAQSAVAPPGESAGASTGSSAGPSSGASGETNVETKIKAAFLYKFAGYIEWPPNAFERANSPIVFGIAGAQGLADELATMVSGRTIDGRSITVRKIGPGEGMAGVHILFVGKTAGSRPGDMLAATKGKPVLTVTESIDGWDQGSVINFVIVDNKVRFDVALGPAESGQIKLSARLLSVARKVFASSAGS